MEHLGLVVLHLIYAILSRFQIFQVKLSPTNLSRRSKTTGTIFDYNNDIFNFLYIFLNIFYFYIFIYLFIL